MRQIDILRKQVALNLNLPKDLVKDVLAFTYKELLSSFRKGDVIEWSGLGTFTVNERKRLLQIESTKKSIEFLEALIPTIEDPIYKEIKTEALLSQRDDLLTLAGAKKKPLNKRDDNKPNKGPVVQSSHQPENEQTTLGGSEDHQGQEEDMWPVPLQL